MLISDLVKRWDVSKPAVLNLIKRNELKGEKKVTDCGLPYWEIDENSIETFESEKSEWIEKCHQRKETRNLNKKPEVVVREFEIGSVYKEQKKEEETEQKEESNKQTSEENEEVVKETVGRPKNPMSFFST